MPKAVAPETRGKNHDNKSNEVDQYSSYETARVNQLTAGIMLHFAKTGERIFGTEYGWCQDKTAGGYRVCAGDFSPDGLVVHRHPPDYTLGFLGRALVRKFS